MLWVVPTGQTQTLLLTSYFLCFPNLKALLDKDFALADLGGSVAVGSNDPRFVCRTSDVSSASSGDQLVVRSVTYTVRQVEDDGTGITTLILEA